MPCLHLKRIFIFFGLLSLLGLWGSVLRYAVTVSYPGELVTVGGSFVVLWYQIAKQNFEHSHPKRANRSTHNYFIACFPGLRF